MSNTLSDINSLLQAIYPRREAGAVASLLLQKIVGASASDVLLGNFELSKVQLQNIEMALERLKLNEPIQYVLGQTEFCGLPFKTDKRALIPRPETEELVSWVLSLKSNAEVRVVLDICTGSGCIAVTLAKNLPDAKVFALDISLDALSLAQENAVLNAVQIEFLHCNILKTDDLGEKFDIIVSNPPYVLLSEKQFMRPNVLDYEPEIALFVSEENPLIFYEHIAHFAQKHLNKNGCLFFEINQQFGNQIVELLQKYQFKNIELKKDISGNDRMCLINS